MKQPQLGQTIVSLRQQKHLTQEELVEQCNINVRTLQRIEAGEVTPREYTIRTILNALDYDYDLVAQAITKKSSLSRIQIAWISGVVYFILGLAETIVDFMRFEPEVSLYFPLAYTGVKGLSLASYIFFMIGFVEVGKHLKNYLLRISAFLMMGALFIINLYDIISIFQDLNYEEFLAVKAAEGVGFGGVNIIFGLALTRLERLGLLTRVAGILEIIAGFFFITVILGLIGLFVLIPITILEVILLYKTYELISLEE